MVEVSTYMDEVGPGLVIVVGLALVIFPEPATSAFGAGLTLFGIAWWAWEWNRGSP